MKQTVFCIAGMHRSGSSLFANWMHESGIFLGFNLYGAESSNPKGHFEDFDFLNLHKADLKKKGMDISGLFIQSNCLHIEQKLLKEATKIISKRRDITLWGWKEPRTTLYLDYWKSLIPSLKVIVLVRPEKEVVKSLYKRLKKNKWYKTNNPLKKLYWWYDINLQPAKWQKKFSDTHYLYYQACKEFRDNYQDDTLYIDTNDFIKNDKKTAIKINDFLKSNIDFKNLDSIFDPTLLTR